MFNHISEACCDHNLLTQKLSSNLRNRLHNRVLGHVRLVNSLANTVKVTTSNSELNQLARVVNGVPARAGSRVLDPGDEPLVDRVSQLLLGRGHALESGEALVAAVEEGDFGAVGGSCVGGSDDVVVGAEE